MEKLVLEKKYKIVILKLFGAHLLHQIKAQQYHTNLDLYQQY